MQDPTTIETNLAPPRRPSERLTLRARRGLALGAVLLAVAIALPRFLTHAPYQRLGVRLVWPDPTGFARIDDVVGPPGKGVLEKGDRLIELDGHRLTQPYVIGHFRKGGWPRDAIDLKIERGGERLTVTVPPLRLSAWQRVRAVALPLIAVVGAPLVAFLLVWRRPDVATAWVFLWFAALGALGTVWNLFRYPQVELTGALTAWLKGYHVLICWYPASFIHFMTVFPRPRWSARGRARNPWFWLVAFAYLTPPLLFGLSALMHRPSDSLYLWFERIVLPLGCLSLFERYGRPGRAEWRPMARERIIALVVAVTLLTGTAVDWLADDSRLMALFSIPLFRLFYTVLLFGLLSVPLLIAYLIANDPAFDPRRLIVRGIPYALLSGVLAALYLATVLVSERLFTAATGEEAVMFNVIAALIVAFAFAPLRDRLQRWLARLYGRDPAVLRAALDEAGRELLGALDRDEVRGAVEAAVQRGLRRPVRIEWPEPGMPRLADRGDVRDDERGAVESLLLQAGIRLENLTLQAQRSAAERRAAEMREAAARAELRALHAQVQPHFLFNALNALSYLTETDPAAAQRFTERLADMLRYTIEAGERPAALLSEEIGFVEDYLGVARERYENPLAFEYRGAPDLLSVAVPPLLLQPLVENSLKHGCSPGAQALHLTLAASRADGWLTLEFRDDGDGNGNGAPGLGVGLQNLEQRVRRFAGQDATMAAERGPKGGFVVRLRWREGEEDAA